MPNHKKTQYAGDDLVSLGSRSPTAGGERSTEVIVHLDRNKRKGREPVWILMSSKRNMRYFRFQYSTSGYHLAEKNTIFSEWR